MRNRTGADRGSGSEIVKSAKLELLPYTRDQHAHLSHHHLLGDIQCVCVCVCVCVVCVYSVCVRESVCV